jgi:Tfp pilus assembly major pilin PilA
MKQKYAQVGSLHVLIIVVLFVALMATLGIVFYQNFVMKNELTTDQNAQQPATPTNPNTAEQVAFASNIYEIDRPKNWTITTSKLPDPRADGTNLKITSGDGKVQVHFIVSGRRSDISCNTGDNLKVSYYNVHPTASTKLTGAPVYMVESISDGREGGYVYAVGLTSDGGDTHSSIGESHCTIAHIGEPQSVVFGARQTITQPNITASISFPQLLAKNQTTVKSMQPIKDILATDDYRTAVMMLESIHKK